MERLVMGFTDLIIKLSNTKFARKFQYEPYIIKSVEYINPSKDDSVLVIYKEADYLQSLILQYIKREQYVSYEVKQDIKLNIKFDKIVLFFSINDIKDKYSKSLSSHIKKNGYLYSIFYLNSSKFFEWTLRLTDRDILKSMEQSKNNNNIAGFLVEDELKLPKQYIAIKKYKLEGE